MAGREAFRIEMNSASFPGQPWHLGRAKEPVVQSCQVFYYLCVRLKLSVPFSPGPLWCGCPFPLLDTSRFAMRLLMPVVCTGIHGDSLVFHLLLVPSLAVGGAADTVKRSGSIAALSMHLLCALSLLRCLLMDMAFGKGTCGKSFCGTIYHFTVVTFRMYF